ncbi:hypothetical protein EF910_35140 [Streptomyces sp. WAC07149]|nr:hypothetical protein EF910_35140 [Streptomyces sp. WAC07149]
MTQSMQPGRSRWGAGGSPAPDRGPRRGHRCAAARGRGAAARVPLRGAGPLPALRPFPGAVPRTPWGLKRRRGYL